MEVFASEYGLSDLHYLMAGTGAKGDKMTSTDSTDTGAVTTSTTVTARPESRSYLSTAITFWPLFLVSALALSGLGLWQYYSTPAPPPVYEGTAILLTLGEDPALTYSYLPELASVQGEAWQRAYQSTDNPGSTRKPVPATVGDGITGHYRIDYIDHYLIVHAYARGSADAVGLANGMADAVAAMGQRIRASELAAIQLEAERWPGAVGAGTPVLSGRVSVVQRAAAAEGPMAMPGAEMGNGLGVWGEAVVKGMAGVVLAGFAVLVVWAVRERVWEYRYE